MHSYSSYFTRFLPPTKKGSPSLTLLLSTHLSSIPLLYPKCFNSVRRLQYYELRWPSIDCTDEEKHLCDTRDALDVWASPRSEVKVSDLPHIPVIAAGRLTSTDRGQGWKLNCATDDEN